MKKSKNVGGENIFVIKIEIPVALKHFTTALTDYFYVNGESFDCKLTKKVANEILKTQLLFYGLQGEYADGDFEACYEEGTKWNSIANDARSWIIKNYPYLNTPIT